MLIIFSLQSHLKSCVPWLLSNTGVIYSVIVINNITDTCCAAQTLLIQSLPVSHTSCPGISSLFSSLCTENIWQVYAKNIPSFQSKTSLQATTIYIIILYFIAAVFRPIISRYYLFLNDNISYFSMKIFHSHPPL